MSENLLDIAIRHTLNSAHGKLPMEITISVPRGSILAVTGPSGSGKTTLLRQIAGLSTPESGYIRHRGQTWFDASSRVNMPVQHRNIGFVFQDYALFPHLTVAQNLLFALEKGTDRSIVEDLLHTIELEQLADRKPNQLSGGQQQRVALARALVRKPDLLLLDEPLSALDSTMRGNLQDLLLKFQRKYGFTMIIVTHDLAEIFRLANHLIVLEQGKVTKYGTPTEVYNPKQMTNDLPALYGKVISVTDHEKFREIAALINHQIFTFKRARTESMDFKAGDSFTIPYQFDPTLIKPLDP